MVLFQEDLKCQQNVWVMQLFKGHLMSFYGIKLLITGN